METKIQDVEATIADRRKTHGAWTQFADLSQHLKDVARDSPSWPRMSASEREAVDAILHKLARVLTGDPHFPDHWHDIGGYARRAEESCLSMLDSMSQEQLQCLGKALTDVNVGNAKMMEEFVMPHGSNKFYDNISNAIAADVAMKGTEYHGRIMRAILDANKT